MTSGHSSTWKNLLQAFMNKISQEMTGRYLNRRIHRRPISREQVSFRFGRKLKLAVCLGCAGLVTACSTTAPVFIPEAPISSQNALVYVYWPSQTWREQSGSRPELQVDGAPLGLLRYKTYIKVELRPGTHEFLITGNGQGADWPGEDKSFALKVDAGEVHYVRLLVKYDQSTNSWGNRGMGYVVQFLPRSERDARVEMGELSPARD